jgi:serine/threonine protein kinase
VFKCRRELDGGYFAIKVIKNKKAHHCQALIELRILEFLNNEVDKKDLHHIIRKYDHFYYKNHLCIVFELLNENLFELLKQNYYQGLSVNTIRFVLKQILEAVYQIQKANLIHCDLKPENILLKIDKENPKNEIVIKITDFGSACFRHHTMFQYIQSRYYRSPEVIMGIPYSMEIDMWSVGCIAAELYLGEPLLPGCSEYDQLYKIVSLLGDIPDYMVRQGRNGKKYYTIDKDTKMIRLKTIEEYYSEFPNDPEMKYQIPGGLTCLDDICKVQKKNLNSSSTDINNDLESFVHFLRGLLTIEPKLRWNAKTALRHPFITRERFEGQFNPYQEEISQLYKSFELSLDPRLGRVNNNNPYHSMIISNHGFDSSNTDAGGSFDVSCYRPNIHNIPLGMLKQFPYAQINKLNLNPEKKQGGNKYTEGNMNNTFMMTSFDQLGGNASFTSGDYGNANRMKFREFKNNNIPNKYNNIFPPNQQNYQSSNFNKKFQKKNSVESQQGKIL